MREVLRGRWRPAALVRSAEDVAHAFRKAVANAYVSNAASQTCRLLVYYAVSASD
jgi:hypothetical protein